jgi:fatty acid desaturase
VFRTESHQANDATNSPRPAAESPRAAPDLEAFAKEVEALRDELSAALSAEDARHLEKMARWGRLASGLGYASAWLAPNPISAGLLALGSSARWTIVMHHISHKGMDAVPDAKPHMNSKIFAQGKRRLIDWLDWVHPEAWAYEHNVLHHYRTGEVVDPDLVEHHMQPVRDAKLPLPAKLAVVGFWALTWRLTYYAPNTFQVLQKARKDRAERRSHEARDEVTPTEDRLLSAFNPKTAEGRAFLRAIAPYAVGRFVVAPLAFLPLGPLASINVLLNTAMAEALTNVHTFCLIAPNHAGDDVVRFDEKPVNRADLYARQVLGSVNFHGGNDVADFLQGFLNYQIEHHLFPELPPLKLRQAQPKVEALCKKYGLPYVREGLRGRVSKLVDIMTGKSSMRRAKTAYDAISS